MRSLATLALFVLLAPAAAAGFGPENDSEALASIGGPEDTKAYPAWPILTADLRQLAADYPDITRLVSAGRSTAGMDLWLVEIADFENPDRIPIGSREVLWIDGGTHANEYSGVMFVNHLLHFLTEGYGVNDTATWIVENRHTYIMPLLNPEGSMNGIGRLNDNTVNINRNYPVGWGDLAENPVMNNPGPFAASEPETRTAIEWWETTRPDYMASIHCCGNLWLYPYGIEGRDPHVDDIPVFERVCNEAYFDVREDCGPIWSTIYPASGSSVDTAYEQVGAIAFGFEMSGREAQLLWGQPFSMTPAPETESESWRGIMHAFTNVHLYGAYPVVTLDAIDAGSVRFRVLNDGYGNLTTGTVRVVDANGVHRVVDLPALAANATGSVTVPGTFRAGEYAVSVEYLKRPLADTGVTDALLRATGTADGLTGTLDAAVSLSDLEVPVAEAPAPMIGLVLASLGVAAFLRRR